MSQKIIRLLIMLVLAVVCTLGSPAIAKSRGTGRVVYIRILNNKGACAVFERDLSTGKRTRLVSLKSPAIDSNPDAFSLAISPDGRNLAVRHKDTLLLWERTTGRTRRISAAHAQTGLSWSPSGKYLMMWGSRFRVYNVKTRKFVRLPLSSEQAMWSANSDAVITAIPKGKGTSIVRCPAYGGKTRTLFHWPRRVKSIAQAPNGSGYALYDTRGIYLVNSRGRHARKLRLALPVPDEDTMAVCMDYNSSGSRLAVSTNYWYGEPCVASTKTLWCVNPKTAKKFKVTEWQDTALPSRDDGSREWSNSWLCGWMGDKDILLYTQMCWGGESLCDNHSDRFILESYNRAKYSDYGNSLFDSGKQCLDLVWWRGQK